MRGKKFEFTEEQIDYIIQNWKLETPHSMKKKFGCSWYAICRVAEDHGLELPKSNKWTEEEITLLRELSNKFHYKEIAKLLDKTEEAVYLKARRLGIDLIQDRKKWTSEEEANLSELWGNMTIDTIAKKLNRTVFSLKVKAVRMKLGPMLQNSYDNLTLSDISEMLGVSSDRIVRWTKYGLKLKQKKLTQNKNAKKYYYVKWNDLIEFLKENQDAWDSRNLEYHMLGEEFDWLKEKRRKDFIENPRSYRKWSEDEIKRTGDLFNLGKSYKEIAKVLNRSEWAVANLLRELGYSYKLPKYWTGKEILYLKENYPNMTQEEIAEHLGRTKKAIGAKAQELGFQKRKIKR